MMTLLDELTSLERAGKSIGVGVIGAGQMGRGMISQIPSIPGLTIAGICDVDRDRAEAAKELYRSQADESEAIVVSTELADIVNARNVDVVVEATGLTEVGARTALAALLARKHLVLLNVEVDITIGPIMKKLFDAAGLVYTGSEGDEPAVTAQLYRFAKTMGFDVLVAGKGKNNPLDPKANPDSAREAAEKKGMMNAQMLSSFQDGTKTMAEMTLLANAIGFVPDVVGMHGISGDLDETLEKLDLKENGGVLSKNGVVEYVNGLAPGVFVIVRGQNQTVRDELSYMLGKKRERQILYRPFHLGSLETPLTIAKAYLHHEAAIVPLGKPVAETVAVAKRDLKAGETLDGIGGFCFRGVIETHETQQAEKHIPIGLISGHSVAKRDIPAGTFLTEEDVEVDTTTVVYRLRSLQDAVIG